ncbi:MAG: hypothetical protein A7316_00160 [Candidatus Altiarchaeales archaeon WOR_SM1_86-2]|nr:MAG: hypothetical protein A7316_00160 [Candidatus Altiarchaeales archaeon WOR_SM1_86-2]
MRKYRKIWYRDNKGDVRCVEPPAYYVEDEGEVIRIEWEDSIQEIPKNRIIEDVEYEDECFISTAVYGTRSEKQLDVLRDFRDDVMKTNFIGKLLLGYYYKIGPGIADKIADDENAKKKLRSLIDLGVSVIEQRNKASGHLKFLYGIVGIGLYCIVCFAAKIITL